MQGGAAGARYQRLLLVLAVAIFAIAAVQAAIYIVGIISSWSDIKHLIAVDYRTLTNATLRWVDGGSFYELEQLAGPYYDYPGAWILYPPTLLLLFVPAAFAPPPLYWAVALLTLAWTVIKHRPALIGWAVIALALANPTTITMILYGNPVIWFAAAVGLGTHYAWPSVFVFLKPTLAPFAFIGANRRRWWVALGVLILVSVPFLGLWYDYYLVGINNRHPSGIWYTLPQVPFMLIPVIAWLASTTHPPQVQAWVDRVGRRFNRNPGGQATVPVAEPQTD